VPWHFTEPNPNPERFPDDRSVVLATRQLTISTIAVLVARKQFDESIWWPVEHVEQICSTHLAWTPTTPLPDREVVTEIRKAAAQLLFNLDS
jgi:hypothetical protein